MCYIITIMAHSAQVNSFLSLSDVSLFSTFFTLFIILFNFDTLKLRLWGS